MINILLSLLQEGSEAASDILKRHPAVGIISGIFTAMLTTLQEVSVQPMQAMEIADLVLKYLGIGISLLISAITLWLKLKEWRKSSKEDKNISK